MTTSGFPSSFKISSAVSITSPVQVWEVNKTATLSDSAKSLDWVTRRPDKSRAMLPSNCYFYTAQLLRHYFTISAAPLFNSSSLPTHNMFLTATGQPSAPNILKTWILTLGTFDSTWRYSSKLELDHVGPDDKASNSNWSIYPKDLLRLFPACRLGKGKLGREITFVIRKRILNTSMNLKFKLNTAFAKHSPCMR